MKTLVAGPWIGEFGWELMDWQGHVRALSKFYDETICIGPESSRHLYSDFADRYLTSVLYGEKFNKLNSDCWFLTGEGREKTMPSKAMVGQILKENRVGLINFDIFLPKQMISKSNRTLRRRLFSHYNDSHTFLNNKYIQKYITFGEEVSGYDLIIHARNREGVRPIDNWSRKKWDNLVNLLPNHLKIASIGLSNAAMHIGKTDNLLDIRTKDLCDVLRASKLIAGPLSGPIHLSSLCNLRQIIWSPRKINNDRCLEDWNPFGLNNKFMLLKNPNPTAIAYSILQNIEEK